MEVERKRPKGGFLGLFDWHSKSKKKLFAKDSELKGIAALEGSDRRKEIEENLERSRLHLIGVNEHLPGLYHKGSSDCSSGSSVTSDEGCGNKAPGVVARLMGLDSLPTSGVVEPYSAPFFDSRSLKACHDDQGDPTLWSDYHTMDYLTMPRQQTGPSWNSTEPRLHKVQNRPIDRFQTEVLPPKSAKPISITHHKLLSPIKSSGFIPTNDAAYIMEAATRIIVPNPLATKNSKLASSGSSSVPLRIRDIKDKIVASNRPSGFQTAKEPISDGGKPGDRSHSVSQYPPSFKALTDLGKRNPESLKSKGKSVSLAVQAKVNVQRREGSSSSNRRSMNQEKKEVKRNQVSESKQNIQNNGQKRTSMSSNVLRQNNQKQNSALNKEKSFSKTSVSSMQERKSYSTSASSKTNKTVSKVVVNSDVRPNKMASGTKDAGKGISSSKHKNSSQKKRSVTRDDRLGEGAGDSVLIRKVEKSIKPNVNIVAGKCDKQNTDTKSKGMDIVSFTFTSPIKRSNPEFESSAIVTDKNSRCHTNSLPDNDQPYIKESEVVSSEFDMVGGEALSVLLEQKLKELANKVDSSSWKVAEVESSVNSASSASSMPNSVLTCNAGSNCLTEQNTLQGSRLGQPRDTADGLDHNCPLKWQEVEDMEEFSTDSNSYETGMELNYCHSSPVFDRHLSIRIGNSGDRRDIMRGNMQGSLAQPHQASYYPSRIDSQSAECETDLSDSASSLSVGDIMRAYSARVYSFADSGSSNNWELEYVRNIISNAELMLEDYALGQAEKGMTTNFFDQYESQEDRTERYGGEYSKLMRKLLFDSVSECLDARCGHLFIRSCNAWSKWTTLFQRKGWLAEELYQEILGWKSMADLMVDELVDKDMSSQYGRWLDFDLEAFEEGAEIEKDIITSLVDELVIDVCC